MTPEQKVKAKIRSAFKARGIWYCTPVGGPYGNAGVPDFLACVKGRMLGVEAKAERGRVTALQAKCHSEIVKSGGDVLIVGPGDLADLDATLDTMMGLGT